MCRAFEERRRNMWHTRSGVLGVSLIALLAPAAVPVAAQERPVGIGVDVGGITSVVGHGADLRVTVSVPIGDRRSIEGFAAAYRGPDEEFHTRGVYGFRFAQRMPWTSRPNVKVFWTVGAFGLIGRDESYACRDGVCGLQRSTSVLPPLLAFGGLGVQ